MSIEPPIRRETYPALRWLGRYGELLALALGVLLGASGLVTSVVGAGWWWAPIGIVAGGLAYGMMKSYCELVRVIASTLLPD